jgi:hypothetical protein
MFSAQPPIQAAVDDQGKPIKPRFKSLHVIYELTKEEKEEKKSMAFLVAIGSIYLEPQTYKEAIISEQAEDWKLAMK